MVILLVSILIIVAKLAEVKWWIVALIILLGIADEALGSK
jgi:hypothetical protein